MEGASMSFFLVTANVGSLFEDPTRLLSDWVNEFLSKISIFKPQFLALHLQEVGGKTYEKSTECVQKFVTCLCECDQLSDYTKIRVFLDEDYTSEENFTALGNMYFVHTSIEDANIWNFMSHNFETVAGKVVNCGNIEKVTVKEKSKFPRHFFPECKWSRKGYLRTRWKLNGTVVDFINIHLFHDASNLAASSEFPSVYCKIRRRAFTHILEKFHTDVENGVAPYFVFGDFNFRCDTEGVIKLLTEDLVAHRIQSTKNDNVRIVYQNSEGKNILCVGKKEFIYNNNTERFEGSWLRKFDKELDNFQKLVFEYPISFPPSYPYEENPSKPFDYMPTRCPSWCDRILLSYSAKGIVTKDIPVYDMMGTNLCMGDHKANKLENNSPLSNELLKPLDVDLDECSENLPHDEDKLESISYLSKNFQECSGNLRLDEAQDISKEQFVHVNVVESTLNRTETLLSKHNILRETTL